VSENPKHYAGQKKIPFGDVPAIVEAELSLAMHEGARRYGAYNWRRDQIRASDYLAAARRHLAEFWELGEDIDGPSGVSHLVKAMATLCVLRDAQINGMLIDDRPPAVSRAQWEHLEEVANQMRERHPEPAERITAWSDGQAAYDEPTPGFSKEELTRLTTGPNWAFGGWAELEGGKSHE
jgi:hypothetical protein